MPLFMECRAKNILRKNVVTIFKQKLPIFWDTSFAVCQEIFSECERPAFEARSCYLETLLQIRLSWTEDWNRDSKFPANANFTCNQVLTTVAVLRAKVSEMLCTLKMVMRCRNKNWLNFSCHKCSPFTVIWSLKPKIVKLFMGWARLH